MTDSSEGKGRAEPAAKRISWVLPLLLVVFVAALASLLALFIQQQRQQRQEVQQRQQLNEELGLPRDYPVELVPLYAGVTVREATRDLATSDDGQPMDHWYVHAEIDEDKDPVYQFYNSHLLDAGLRQTQHIGIPTGYGVDYADERHVVSVIIEHRANEELLQIELNVYRLSD